MSKYRIKEVTAPHYKPKYYPQYRTLWFWRSWYSAYGIELYSMSESDARDSLIRWSGSGITEKIIEVAD